MVKDAALRKRKYDASLDPKKIARNLARLKPGMVEQESVYLSQIADVERKVKHVCEAAGVPSYQVAQYINVGRQCYSLAKRFSGATRDGEAQNVVDHWAARGLNGVLLQQACVAGGCHPAAPPVPIRILQILYALGTTDVNTTSTTFVDMPEMSVTITVREGSKVKIEFSSGNHVDAEYQLVLAYFRLLRDTTVLAGTSIYGQSIPSPSTLSGNGNITWIDEPGEGTHTYKIQWRVTMFMVVHNRPVSALDMEHRSLIVTEYSG